MEYHKLQLIKPYTIALELMDEDAIRTLAENAGFSRGSGINNTWNGPATSDDRTHDALYRFAAMVITEGHRLINPYQRSLGRLKKRGGV